MRMAMKLINERQVNGLVQAYQDIKSLLDGAGVDLSKVMTDVVKTPETSEGAGDEVYYNAEELLELLKSNIDTLTAADNVAGSVDYKIKSQVLDKQFKDYVKVNITAIEALNTTNDASNSITYVAGNYPVFDTNNEPVFDINKAQVTAAVTAAGIITLNAQPYTFSSTTTTTSGETVTETLAAGEYDITLGHKNVKNVSVTKGGETVSSDLYTVDSLQGKVQFNDGVTGDAIGEYVVTFDYDTVNEAKAAVTDGTVAYKVFPIAQKTFGTLENDYLLDNEEWHACAYSNSVQALSVSIAQNSDVINQLAAKVADVSIQDALKKATEELEAALAAQGSGMDARVTALETLTADAGLEKEVSGVTTNTIKNHFDQVEADAAALKARVDAVKYTVEEGGEDVEKDLVDRFVRDEAEVTALKTKLDYDNMTTVLAANSDTGSAQTFSTLNGRLNDSDERVKALEDEVIAARTSTAIQTNSTDTTYTSLDARLEAIETKEAADKTAIDTELGANILSTAAANSDTGVAKNHATVDARISDAESRVKSNEDELAVLTEFVQEKITITAENATQFSISYTPSTDYPVSVYVNGIKYFANSGSFTVSGSTITWVDEFPLRATTNAVTGEALETPVVAEVYVEYWKALIQA